MKRLKTEEITELETSLRFKAVPEALMDSWAKTTCSVDPIEDKGYAEINARNEKQNDVCMSWILGVIVGLCVFSLFVLNQDFVFGLIVSVAATCGISYIAQYILREYSYGHRYAPHYRSWVQFCSSMDELLTFVGSSPEELPRLRSGELRELTWQSLVVLAIMIVRHQRGGEYQNAETVRIQFRNMFLLAQKFGLTEDNWDPYFEMANMRLNAIGGD